MKKFRLRGYIGVAALLAFAVIAAGCENGTTPDGEKRGGDPGKRAFSISGTFNRLEGNSAVRFTVESDGVSRPALNRAITADSYTINGVLEDGDLTIRLAGSYDPGTGVWSVSAKSSAIIYAIDGKVDGAGESQGSTATIAVKDTETQEWVPYVFPVTETAEMSTVDISTETSGSSDDSGLPPFARGYWHSNTEVAPGYSISMSALVSGWKIKLTGVAVSPDYRNPFEKSLTIIEYADTDGHEIIVCYPEYTMTSENVAAVITAYLELENGTVAALNNPSDILTATGKWVYVNSDSGSIITGGFPDAEFEKLRAFWATGGWEKWAAANNVESANKYAKFTLRYRNGNTAFDMILMAKGDGSEDYTVDFDSLAALKAANPVVVDEENSVMTFSR